MVKRLRRAGQIFRRLFAVATHVQPVDTGLFNDVWIYVTLPTWRSFFNDWQRYGLAVAWHNLKVMVR